MWDKFIQEHIMTSQYMKYISMETVFKQEKMKKGE